MPQAINTAGANWPEFRDEVIATFGANPPDAVLFAWQTLQDAELAWSLAHSLDLREDHV